MKEYMIVLAVVVAAAQQAQALPITFIHEGTGSAILHGTSLGVVDFTITAQGDTDEHGAIGDRAFPHYSASITMTVGRSTVVADFITPTFTAVTLGGEAGFSKGSYGAEEEMYAEGVLFVGGVNGQLGYWDAISSIGPVTTQGTLMQWDNDIETTGGTLYFEDGASPYTFTAIVVPEPATLLLLGLGAAMVRRRRSI